MKSLASKTLLALYYCHISKTFQVKIWFQNHRYKYKRQAKEKAMAEQPSSNTNLVSSCNYPSKLSE